MFVVLLLIVDCLKWRNLCQLYSDLSIIFNIQGNFTGYACERCTSDTVYGKDCNKGKHHEVLFLTFRVILLVMPVRDVPVQGRIQDFKLGGADLK